MSKLLAWLPIVLTAFFMWYARVTNVGVTNYNIFILCLLAWSLIIIAYYRALFGKRR